MWLDETAQLVEKRLKPATRGLNAAGAFTKLLMVILVTAHVISRAFFGKPLVGTVELEELMIVILVFCGMACTQITGNHISVDFVTMRLSEKTRSILGVITALISTCLLFALTWPNVALSLVYLRDGMATFQLRIPLFWVLWVIALGFFLFGLSAFTDLLKALSVAVKNRQIAAALIAMLVTVALVALPFITGMLDHEVDLRTAQYFSISGGNPGLRPDLVRHHRGGDLRNRYDHTARGHQRLHHERHSRGCTAGHSVQGHFSVSAG
jgi:TRAP-type C4-dicarboxylate transport system permease small subunit